MRKWTGWIFGVSVLGQAIFIHETWTDTEIQFTYGNHWRNCINKIEGGKPRQRERQTYIWPLQNATHINASQKSSTICIVDYCHYLVHHQPILKCTKIGESKHHKNKISLPIDLVERFLFGNHLGDEVGSGGLGGCHSELKNERVFLGKRRFRRCRWRWRFLGSSVHRCFQWSNGWMIDASARRRGDWKHWGSISSVHPPLFSSFWYW